MLIHYLGVANEIVVGTLRDYGCYPPGIHRYARSYLVEALYSSEPNFDDMDEIQGIEELLLLEKLPLLWVKKIHE